VFLDGAGLGGASSPSTNGGRAVDGRAIRHALLQVLETIEQHAPALEIRDITVPAGILHLGDFRTKNLPRRNQTA
jgi:hypothetical protein